MRPWARLHPRMSSKNETCPGQISAAAPHPTAFQGQELPRDPHCFPPPLQTTTHPSLVQKTLFLEAPLALSRLLSPPGSCHWPLGRPCCSLRTVASSSHYLLQHVSFLLHHMDLDFTCDGSTSQFQKHPSLAQIPLPPHPTVESYLIETSNMLTPLKSPAFTSLYTQIKPLTPQPISSVSLAHVISTTLPLSLLWAPL